MKYKNAALPVRLEIHSLEAVGTETSQFKLHYQYPGYLKEDFITS